MRRGLRVATRPGTRSSYFWAGEGILVARVDIERFGFVNKKGEFLGMRSIDRLLAVSEAANQFVRDHLDQIARRDTPPASCRDMDAPVRGWIEVEADHRTYTY